MVLNTDNDENRRAVESCYRNTSTLVNPIIEWTDDDVWEFLKKNNCESNPLYRNGHKRVGCIGCPIAGGKKQKEEFQKYPKYRDAYVRAFDKMIINKGIRNESWRDGEHVMRWWVGDNPDQITIEDYLSELDEDEFNKETAMP